MDRDRPRAQDLLHRIALEYALSPSHPQAPAQAQTIPVNVYETSEDVVIVAPMPGVEPDDIDIEVLGSVVNLRASLRGPHQQDREYLVHEWTYGPYTRSITLPMDVDSAHANASHGNGVLVLSLPKAQRTRTVKVPLRQVTASEGTHQGHSGHHTSRQGLEQDSTQGE